MDLTNPYWDKLSCVKAFYGLLSQDNNLKTYNRGIFASDNETLKVIEAYEKHWKTRETREYQKLLTEWTNIMHGILKHNTSKFFQTKTWDLKVKKLSGGQKTLVTCYYFDQ
jgi:ATP-binding cassette subfamily F protein uup